MLYGVGFDSDADHRRGPVWFLFLR